MLCAAFFSFISTFFYDNLVYEGLNKWSVVGRLFEFISITICLLFLGAEFPSVYKKIPEFYLVLSAAYSIITLFFVLSGLSSTLEQRNWSGRFSIGYPPMDSSILGAALVFLIETKRRIYIKILLSMLFTTVILMQNTLTGYLVLGIILFVYSIYKIEFESIIIFAAMLAALAFVFGYMLQYVIGDTNFFFMLLDEKLGSIFANSNHSSIEIREIQIYQLYNIIKADVFVLFFGIGGASAVENLYISAFGMFGLVGLFFLVLSLSIPFIKIELNKFMKCAGRPFIALVLNYFIAGLALNNIYLYPQIFIGSYILSLMYLNSVRPTAV